MDKNHPGYYAYMLGSLEGAVRQALIGADKHSLRELARKVGLSPSEIDRTLMAAARGIEK